MHKLIAEDARLRYNNLNSLRLAMALLVVWSHSFAIWDGSEAGEPLSMLFGGLYNAGNIGVLSFFTISGFLISLSYQRSSWWGGFLGRRFARIYPGYLVAVTLSSLLVVPLVSSRDFFDLYDDEVVGMFSNLLLRNYIVASDAFGGQNVNGSLWSIPFEFWCYLGVMLLGLTRLLRIKPLAPVLAAILMLAKFSLDFAGRRPGGGLTQYIIGYQYLWFTVLPPFLLGMSILSYRDRIPRSGLLLLGLVLVTILSAHLASDRIGGASFTALLFPPTLAYGLFYFAFHPRWQFGDAARYGDFSYGCYLYAFPIQLLLNNAFHGDETWRFPVFILLSMLLSLVAGVSSWFLVERWFERRPAKRARRPLDEEALLVSP